MKKYRYDIHIHSALSPCADRLNSPNNILNMAHLTNLDIIAITDHNSLKQTYVAGDLQSSYQFIYLYGVEVSTIEGYHMLCFLDNVEKAKSMDKILELEYTTKNNSNQSSMIYDEYDNELYEYPYNLHESTSLSAIDLRNYIDKVEGILILAHIERYSSEMIKWVEGHQNTFHAIEVNVNTNIDILFGQYPWLTKMRIVRNSDAHTIMEIGQKAELIELEELSVKSFFQSFRGRNDD